MSQAVADGADLFFRETFGGNGRTCGTCHRAENNMGLDVEFISGLPPDDKLFIAELPASEGGVPGLERPSLMRAHGLILMNSDGFESPTSQGTEFHPHDGGFGSSVQPNRDCDGDGVKDCFGDGSFNVPPLIEAADTEPFFHNHNAATIEAAVRFYATDKAFGGAPFPLSDEDVLNLAAFLRVLNAAFNSAISIQRNSAALALESSRDAGTRETVNMLLALSNSEAADAVDVLSARKLNPKAVRLLKRAISKNGRAMKAKPSNTRQALIRSALNDFRMAKAGLGTGLDFVLGEGNLLF